MQSDTVARCPRQRNKTTIYAPIVIRCCRYTPQSCETASCYVRCWKWSPRSRLAITCFDRPSRWLRSPGECFLWSRRRCVVWLFRSLGPIGKHRGVGVKSGNLVSRFFLDDQDLKFWSTTSSCAWTLGGNCLHLITGLFHKDLGICCSCKIQLPSLHKYWFYCWKSRASGERTVLCWPLAYI